MYPRTLIPMQFYLDTKTEIKCEPIPTGYEKHRAFPNALLGYFPFGHVISQSIAIDGFTIYNTVIKADDFGRLYIRKNRPCKVFHCSHRNDLNVYCEGLGAFIQKEREFNISHINLLDCYLNLSPGLYSIFDIHYSTEYLQRFVPYFPALEVFLKNIENGKTCRLAPAPYFATTEMLQVIQSMLQHEYVSKFDEVYAECKSLELLTLALHCIGESSDNRHWAFSSSDKNTFQSVHNWLIAHFDNPGTLKEIALRFGLNEYKLKRGFKQLYGYTVFEFLLEQKMSKARDLLLNSNTSIEGIAYETGYSKLPHFSTAYKNFFGYPPIVERKRK